MSGRAAKAAEARKLTLLAGGKADEGPVLEAMERLGFKPSVAVARFLTPAIIEGAHRLRRRAASAEDAARLDAAMSLLLSVSDPRVA